MNAFQKSILSLTLFLFLLTGLGSALNVIFYFITEECPPAEILTETNNDIQSVTVLEAADSNKSHANHYKISAIKQRSRIKRATESLSPFASSLKNNFLPPITGRHLHSLPVVQPSALQSLRTVVLLI